MTEPRHAPVMSSIDGNSRAARRVIANGIDERYDAKA
jgi:hypothetical protein